jgi:uncharacterized protein (DUF302 family)
MMPGLKKVVPMSYDVALVRVVEALAAEGFGVLTQIDVHDTLEKKLGVSFRRYKIIGACNPPFAHRALQAELDVGLMLPCNVIVYELDRGQCVVAAIDPMQTVAAHHEALRPIAAEVQQKLAHALARLD